ncbi:hypothetical protein BaRGS_00023270 [Batillaria attramentaria]|uniref:von Willebrand factor D and EGF domain-containing protein-like n=1 Tax=Batillaria attramentaria TaxID=370345 RepID=A0ABD0KEC5_9CAEN
MLCTEDWGRATPGAASLTVPLVASKDQVQDGASHLLLSFEKLIGAGGGLYQEVFSGYQLDSVQVEVEKDPAESCTLVTDPHITSIDTDRTFNLYRVGDYTAYHSPSRHFEVQIRTWPCNGGRVTCICGVAIREKNDLIRIHGCDRAYYSRSIGSPDIEVPRPLREGTTVMQSTDGHEISVSLPSGSEVTVKAFSNYGGHFNVHLVIPSVDKGKGQGLCGTFDGDRTNDFTHRDGTVDSQCSSYCTPQAFTESWKNGHSTSLFRMVPPAVDEEYTTKYCQCQNGTLQINCTARGHINNPAPCPTCIARPFPEWNGTWEWTTNGRRSLDDEGAVYADTDEIATTFDPDDYTAFVPATPSWPTPSGITEWQAEARCRQALQGSQLWSHCHGQTEHTGNTIDNCKEDILFGDSYDSLESLVDSFTSDCQAELAKDPDNYVTNAEGETVMKPEISTDVCSTTCLQHGRCQRGLCLCSAGYTGDTCQLVAGQGPQLLRIRGRSEFCDVNVKPCRRVFIDADNIEMTETMACKVQEILPNGTISSEVSIEEAMFMSGTKLMCYLPDSRVKSDRSVAKFRISATLDGSVYGNELNLTVYDSICLNCSKAGCVKLPDTCMINDLCYADGDLNPGNEGQICETATNTSIWTNIYPEMAAPVLTGPSHDGAFVCAVSTSERGPTARYKVSWSVDGHPYPRQRELNLPVGVYQAVYNLEDLPPAGMFQCKISSHYTDRNINSPRLVSNAIDLSVSSYQTDSKVI